MRAAPSCYERLDRRPDQQRHQNGWHRNSLLELRGYQPAFQRGARGSIRGRAGRIKRA